MKKTLLWTCAALLLFVATPRVLAQNGASNAIIENGVARATIYRDAAAPDAVQLAATELQNYLKLVSGATVPIVTNATQMKGFAIYLGDTDFARKHGARAAEMPHDGFRILSGSGWLVIAGRDYSGPVMTGFNNPWRLNESYNPKLKISSFGDAGTLFGAYSFLEKVCGVRWYMPGELGTVAPPAKTVRIPKLDVRRAPAFEHRHVYYGFMERSDDDALWYRRAGYGTPYPVQVSHSFGQFFIRYKDSHPEYFALIDGQHDFTTLSTATGPGNLNLTNPGLIQQAIRDIGKYFDDNPQQKIFPLVPNDGMARISEDPQSQAQLDKMRGETGEFSNYVWGFIDQVARGVAKTHPDKIIGGIAYEKYLLPPSNIAHLSPNVAVLVTKQRSRFPDEKYRREIRETMRAWSEKANAVYNWEYYCNTVSNENWRGYPMFFSGILQNDLKFLRGLGSKGEFIEAESWTPNQYVDAPDKIRINEPGLQHPLLYLTARLLWEPKLDTKALLSEYYRLFYGPAETPMRTFWETIEASWNRKGFHMNPAETYDAETLNRLLENLRDAKAAASEGSVYRKRVDLIWDEFAPATQIAARLVKWATPKIDAPKIAAQNANRGALLQLLDRSYQIAAPATNVRAGWDENNLYLDFSCYEPAMAKLKTNASTRDSAEPRVWEDDSVEVFLTTNEGTTHFILNAAGVLFDEKRSGEGVVGNAAWNGDAQVSVTKEAARWVAKIAIPWRDLGIEKPQQTQMLRANFYRNRYAGQPLQQQSWAPLKSGGYYAPSDFGTLTLSAESAPEAKGKTLSIVPAGIENYGSGASLQNFYSPGGVPNVGLFVGQPNPLTRNDRALFRFALSSLLERENEIAKVELAFATTPVTGDDAARNLEIERLNQPYEDLSRAIANSDADTVRRLSVTSQDAEKVQRIDVTKEVQAALAFGDAAAIFRFRDVEAERLGNPKLQPIGVGITQNPLPFLLVTWKENRSFQ